MGAMKNLLIEQTDTIMGLLAQDGVQFDDMEDFEDIEEIIMTSKSMAEALERIGRAYK